MDILTTLYYLTAATPIAIAESLLYIDSIKEKNYVLQKEAEDKKALIDYNSEVLENTMSHYSPVKRPYQQFSKADEEKLKILLHSLNKNEELTPLIDTLIQYIGISNLKSLILNMKTLDIKYKPFRKRPRDLFARTAGTYNFEKNEITIYKNKNGVLEHELLHLATSHENTNDSELDYAITGFNIYNQYIDWFSGLNEGYTEILNQRIFHTKKTSYHTNVQVIKYLENIFEDEKDMEKTYFNNDIDTFIYTFLEYGTQDEFLDIMYFLDLYTCIPVDERDRSYIINLICDIVKRSGRKDSIDKCKKLDEENETLFKKLVKKIS